MEMGILDKSAAGQILWGAEGGGKGLPGGEGVDMKCKGLKGWTFVEMLFYQSLHKMLSVYFYLF